MALWPIFCVARSLLSMLVVRRLENRPKRRRRYLSAHLDLNGAVHLGTGLPLSSYQGIIELNRGFEHDPRWSTDEEPFKHFHRR